MKLWSLAFAALFLQSNCHVAPCDDFSRDDRMPQVLTEFQPIVEWSLASLTSHLRDVVGSERPVDDHSTALLTTANALATQTFDQQLIETLARSEPSRILALAEVLRLSEEKHLAESQRLLAILIDSAGEYAPSVTETDLETFGKPIRSWSLEAVAGYFSTAAFNNVTGTKRDVSSISSSNLVTIGPLCLLARNCAGLKGSTSDSDVAAWCDELLGMLRKQLFDKAFIDRVQRTPEVWPYLGMAWVSINADYLTVNRFKTISLNMRKRPILGDFIVYDGENRTAQNVSESNEYRICGIELKLHRDTTDPKIAAILRLSGVAEHVTIFADSLEIDDTVKLAGARIEIFARKIKLTRRGCINTSGRKGSDATAQLDAAGGQDGGAVVIHCEEISIEPRSGSPFVLTGGAGGTADQGAPGTGGAGGSIQIDACRLIADDSYSLVRNYGGLGGRSRNVTAPDGATGGIFLRDRLDAVNWLSSVLTECRLKYIEALYLYEGNDASQALRETHDLIRELERHLVHLGDRRTSDSAPLQTALSRAQLLRRQMQSGLDYFGKPPGWTPELSASVYDRLFKEEVVPAIKMLSLLNSVQTSWKENQQNQESMGVLADRSRSEAEQLLSEAAQIAGANDNPPFERLEILRRDIEACRVDSEALLREIEAKSYDLKVQAEEMAREPAWKKGLTILGSVCSIVPIPQVALAGNVLARIMADDTNREYAANVQSSAKAVQELYSSVVPGKPDKKADSDQVSTDDKKADAKANSDQASADDKKADNPKQNDFDAIATTDKIFAAAKGIESLVNATGGMFKKVPEAKFQAIFGQLKDSDPPYRELLAKAESLTTKKQELQNRLDEMLTLFATKLAQAAACRSRADSLSRQLNLGANAFPTLEAQQAVSELQEQAQNRVRKYHFFAARAFAHRVLEPYPIDFDPVRFHTDVIAALKRNVAGNPPPDPEQVALQIKGQIESDIRAKLLDTVENFKAESPIVPLVTLSATENGSLLRELNEKRFVSLNLTTTPWSNPYVDSQTISGRIKSIECESVVLDEIGENEHENVNIRVYAPQSATLIRGGTPYVFHYDEGYYRGVLATFSVTDKGVTPEGKPWKSLLDDDIFANILSGNDKKHEKAREMAQLLKWPGADSDLLITLSPGRKVKSLVLKVIVQGLADPKKDKRISVRSVTEGGGQVTELTAVPILVQPRNDGSTTPFTLVRNAGYELELTAVPFFGNCRFEGWRVNGKKYEGDENGSLRLVVTQYHSIDAIYERSK